MRASEGLTNIVDVYVRHLREKVDAPHPVKRDPHPARRRLFALGGIVAVRVRSIRFRLTAWYAGLLTAVVVALGALLFVHLETYLENTLLDAQARRARQIADTLVANVGQTGEGLLVARQVAALYDPGKERTLHPDHGPRGLRVVYLSGVPISQAFDPAQVPAAPVAPLGGVAAPAADAGRPGAPDRHRPGPGRRERLPGRCRHLGGAGGDALSPPAAPSRGGPPGGGAAGGLGRLPADPAHPAAGGRDHGQGGADHPAQPRGAPARPGDGRRAREPVAGA